MSCVCQGSSVLLQEADRWVKHYTQAFHARMALADQAAASSGTRGNEAAATHYWVSEEDGQWMCWRAL